MVWVRTNNPLISRWPSLPPELQPWLQWPGFPCLGFLRLDYCCIHFRAVFLPCSHVFCLFLICRAGQCFDIVWYRDMRQDIVADFGYCYIVIWHKCRLFLAEKAVTWNAAKLSFIILFYQRNDNKDIYLSIYYSKVRGFSELTKLSAL